MTKKNDNVHQLVEISTLKDDEYIQMKLVYRRDIDGLRAIAVLSVLVFHAFPSLLRGGFIGVDVFFVISGFLISQIILEQIKHGQFSLGIFYIKRIKRIFPALITVLLSCIVAGYYLLFDPEYLNLGKHIGGSALFINNFILWKETGYFDVTSDFKPLLHLWSLGIEEQFYLIWPFIILFAWKKQYKLLHILGVILILSFTLNILRATHHGAATFYLPISRFWELTIGAWVAYIYADYQKRLLKQINLLCVFSFIMLLLSIYFLNKTIPYPSWAALLPTIFTALLLMHPQSAVNTKILSYPLLRNIGLISYPLYLWHWVLLSFSRIIYAGPIPHHITVVLIIFSFVLSWLTYQFIEKPIRFSKLGLEKESGIAQILVVLILFIGALGFIIKINSGLPNRDINITSRAYHDDIAQFENYRQQVLPCIVAKQETKKLTWCYQTQMKTAPTVAIWGDSHADHLFPGLMENDPNTNWLLIGQTSCPPTLNVKASWVGEDDKCLEANKTALNILTHSKEIKLVVISTLGAFYTNKHGFAANHQNEFDSSRFILQSTKIKSKNKAKILLEGYDDAITLLEASGKKVIWFHDIPELPFMPSSCIKRPLARNEKCTVSKFVVEKRQKIYEEILLTLAKRHPNLKIYNPIDLICNATICSPISHAHLLYRDSHHLSLAGSQYIGKHFIKWRNRGKD